MSADPRTRPLCATFTDVSKKTWKDLKDAYNLRLSLAEPAITDYLILDVLRHHNTEVLCKKFTAWEEGKTCGADWEWWIIGSDRTAFGVRMQAKKLDSRLLRYREIGHTVGKAKKSQIDLLIGDAANAGLFPMYCFYNYLPSPSSPLTVQCSRKLPWDHFGCSIADAHFIKKCLSAGKDDFTSIAPSSLPLSCLICCPYCLTLTGSSALSQVAYAAAVHLQDLHANPDEGTNVPDLITTDNLPSYVRTVIEYPDATVDLPPDRAIDGLLIVREAPEAGK